jgi:hypothetical protein
VVSTVLQAVRFLLFTKKRVFLVKLKFLCHITQLSDDYFTWNLAFLARVFNLLFVLDVRLVRVG